MKVLVSGWREWKNHSIIWYVLDTIHDEATISEIIEGCARGVDSLAEQWAQRQKGVSLTHMPADWKRYGKAAGPIRNHSMLALEPDLVVAFHPNFTESRGTRHMVEITVANKTPLILLPPNSAVPETWTDDAIGKALLRGRDIWPKELFPKFNPAA